MDANTIEELSMEVTVEETQRVLRDMGSYKAHGPDGFRAIFFKKTWDITRAVVHSFVRKSVEEGMIFEKATESSLALIPKESKPCNICEFMPLSPCNVAYKLVSKVIVKRLKHLMKELISLCQASFLPGCQGLDNVVILQEFVHSLRFTKAKKGAAIIKVGLEKAYDQMEWAFVEQTLEDAGMLGKIVYVIMKLLSCGSCYLICNEEATDGFKPSRGLHQGDPLSSNLFVQCMERLGALAAEQGKGWKSEDNESFSQRSRSVIRFFADDLILFSEVVDDQLQYLKEGLGLFCQSSGQRVNFGKSAMLCLENVHPLEAK